MFDKDDGDEHENFGNRWWIKLAQKYIPYVDEYGDGQFFITIQTSLTPPTSKKFATRLFFALITVELMDAVFALDSIPAILSLTSDPLVVYTSNIFAILGLRALYFAISGMVSEFHFLKYGLAIILIFIGVKMLISEYYKIPLVTALLFNVVVIVVSVFASATGMPENEARSSLNQLRSQVEAVRDNPDQVAAKVRNFLGQYADQAKQQARQVAAKVQEGATVGAWATFGVLAVTLIVAILGARAGIPSLDAWRSRWVQTVAA